MTFLPQFRRNFKRYEAYYLLNTTSTNENGELIGYYEKHEYRNAETANLYDFLKKHQSP